MEEKKVHRKAKISENETTDLKGSQETDTVCRGVAFSPDSIMNGEKPTTEKEERNRDSRKISVKQEDRHGDSYVHSERITEQKNISESENSALDKKGSKDDDTTSNGFQNQYPATGSSTTISGDRDSFVGRYSGPLQTGFASEFVDYYEDSTTSVGPVNHNLRIVPCETYTVNSPRISEYDNNFACVCSRATTRPQEPHLPQYSTGPRPFRNIHFSRRDPNQAPKSLYSRSHSHGPSAATAYYPAKGRNYTPPGVPAQQPYLANFDSSTSTHYHYIPIKCCSCSDLLTESFIPGDWKTSETIPEYHALTSGNFPADCQEFYRRSGRIPDGTYESITERIVRCGMRKQSASRSVSPQYRNRIANSPQFQHRHFRTTVHEAPELLEALVSEVA